MANENTRFIRAGRYGTKSTSYPRVTGNGTKSAPNNIETLDWQGNLVLAGGISCGDDVDIDGALGVTGNTRFGGSVEITSGQLKVTKPSSSGYPPSTEITEHNVTAEFIHGDYVYAGSTQLFAPAVNDFRIFFNYPARTNEIYFSIPSRYYYPTSETSNVEVLQHLCNFLHRNDYRNNNHLNTDSLIALNKSSIYSVHGAFNGHAVIGIYQYKGSEEPEYQIDIICIDSSETSGYKIYTWVTSTTPPTPSGETWVTMQDIFINKYPMSAGVFGEALT